MVHQLAGNNSIGRITTAGAVTNYTGIGIKRPLAIAAGPDGALWFTNERQQLDRADHHRPGRSPTTPAPASAARTRSSPGRTGPCGSPTRTTPRSGGSPPPGWSPTTPAPASTSRTGSPRGPTGRCGSPTAATTRSGGSPPPVRSPTTPAPASPTRGDRGRAGRGAVVHQLRYDNSIGRITTAGVVTNYRGTGIDDPDGIAAGPDGALWFTNSRQQLDRADHHRRGGHQLHRHRHQQPRGDHGRTGRRAVVHQLRQQLDRADHHRRGGHQLHRRPASTDPEAITAGPDGALWFTNHGNSSIGRITTAGDGHQLHRTPASAIPGGISSGPTGPCGSPTSATTRSGGSPPAGVVTNYTGAGIDSRRHHRRARRGPVVHQRRQQVDRADHHHRGGHQLHRHRHRRP